MKEQTENNMVSTLKAATGDLLNEETLSAIEKSFNESVNAKVEERVALQVEKALIEQDEDHAAKLESLLEAIDADHSNKLNRVVKAITENHTQKLRDVAKKYGSDVLEEAAQFKGDLVDRISNYLELYIENTIPAEDIKQAVENKTAERQLSEMRKFLAVNDALSKDSIRSAIIDGKKQIQESTDKTNQLNTENNELKLQLESLQREKLLEEKTAGLPTVKKKYITRVLSNKPLDFIEENFDYTLKLFEKTEEDKIQQAKKQASRGRAQVDRPEKSIVQESKQTTTQSENENQVDHAFDYMSELSKF